MCHCPSLSYDPPTPTTVVKLKPRPTANYIDQLNNAVSCQEKINQVHTTEQ